MQHAITRILALAATGLRLAGVAGFLLAAAAQAASQGKPSAGPGDLALVRLEAAIDIDAPPSEVWGTLLTSAGQAALTGFKPDRAGAALTGWGQALHGTGAYDQGTIAVTRLVPEKEIRVAWDPDHGGYLCRTGYRLEARGKGTRLIAQDWYSEDKPGQADANREGARRGLEQGLAAFRKTVEREAAR